jgi:hypothetical protein
MSSSNGTNTARALRTAVIVSGLVASSAALSGCENLRNRIVDGTSASGEVCVGWSMQGSPRSCCESRGGLYSGGIFGGSCTPMAVMGPFLPPAMEA